MRNLVRKFLAPVAPLLLFLLLIAGIVLLGRSLLSVFAGLQKEVAAALITAFGAVTVALVSVLGTRAFERRREVDAALRVAKAPIYEDFVNSWMQIIASGATTTAATADPPSAQVGSGAVDLQAFMQRFASGLLLYGSDNMVKSWSHYRRGFFSSNSSPDPDPNLDPSVLLGFEDVLIAVRKEFGHKDKLVPGDLLGLFINDVDVLLKLAAQRKASSTAVGAEQGRK